MKQHICGVCAIENSIDRTLDRNVVGKCVYCHTSTIGLMDVEEWDGPFRGVISASFILLVIAGVILAISQIHGCTA